VEEDREKRRFPRVSVNFVTVEVLSPTGEPGDPELCFVINLSENGMMFRGQREYEPRQSIVLTFTLPGTESEDLVIRTDALVIHKQTLETSKFFGVQFKNLGIAEHKYLRGYVKGALQGGQAGA